ncbi:MAG: enoyl-CoA hydratase/isomerase family protein [Bacteroidetes bacterium]|nr:enoyl-CoA hydratase/isomerase family protein [Bacteroidota bacterium]MCB9227434.1 enoyl-CoA hydratase/isomerase family protein [Chitinophagales bacterium]
MNAEAKAQTVIPATKRHIRKAAVLGSGVMGSRIACHFANIGLEVVLLDIVPFNLSEEDKKKPAMRNSLVNRDLQATLKSNPSPIYDKNFVNRITTGNFDDNMNLISDCDWVIEVVIERLDIKKQVYENVEKYRKPGTLITSNTSGIPIEMLMEGRSEDFQKHFCGTHFFNPPRYLKLFEIIPSSKTDVEIVKFFENYADLYLGKTPVLCKDTPAFIANRIGVFSMSAIFKLQQEMGLSVADIDALTGTLTGKPKSATFRTADVVGLDTLIKVAKGVYDNAPKDEMRETFNVPDYVLKMEENKWLGDKTKQGFYKKTTDENGKKVILQLDLKSFEYVPSEKSKFASVGAAKQAGGLNNRLKTLAKGKDEAAQFLNKLNFMVFQYVSNRIPEISDELYRIDDAMRAGFGWQIGPYEQWDILGVATTVANMKEAGFAPAKWVDEMLASGADSFYKVENGALKYYDIPSKSYKVVPGRENFVILDNLRSSQEPVYKNSGCTVHDLGDGVMCVEFQTKMNSIGSEVLQGINKAIDIAEKDGWKGIVIGNNAPNFSAGANLAMILMQAAEQEWDELNFAIKYFQNTVMRIRHCAVPVVAAPHGMTLGGGCEITMHSDAAFASAETYIGLVEVGVGVIPAGGGTKEFALRASDAFATDTALIPTLTDRFTAIATAKVATSAHEGFQIGVLDRKKDVVVVNENRAIAEAKEHVLALYNEGYTQPVMRTDITVLGRTGLAALYAGIAGFQVGKYASEHDALISRKIAYVLCGGDLSQPTQVSEQYLLDLEREAFLSLCGERKTLERMQSILKTGKPLRN